MPRACSDFSPSSRPVTSRSLRRTRAARTGSGASFREARFIGHVKTYSRGDRDSIGFHAPLGGPMPSAPGCNPRTHPRPCPSTPRHPAQVGSHPAVAVPGRVMQGTHRGRHLFREVPIQIRRQGASRSVQPGSSDAADDPVPLHGCPTRSGSGWGRDGEQPYRHCLCLCPASLPSPLRVFARPRESPPPQCGPYAFSPAGISNGSHWERDGMGQVANAENAQGGL